MFSSCRTWLSAGLVLIALAFVTRIAPVGAQGGVILTINQISTIDFPNLTAYVTVSDGNGIPIEGLNQTNFQVIEDGRPTQAFAVDSLLGGNDPISVVLAIDTSGSMIRAISDAQTAAKTLLSQLGASDQAAVLMFAEGVDQLQGFTSDTSRLTQAIDRISVEPLARTALHEAVYDAAELAETLPPGRRAIVVLTDGTNTVEGLSLDDAIERAQGANVPVYTIGLLGGEFDPAPVRRLAKLTGGRYLETPSSSELVQTFGVVANQLRHQYAVSYQSNLMPDGLEHTLTVRATLASGESAEDTKTFFAVANKPFVVITHPPDGTVVRGRVAVQAQVDGASPIQDVRLEVDGTQEGRDNTPPFEFDLDTTRFSTGPHTLRVVASDQQGRMGDATVAVNVEQPVLVTITSPQSGEIVEETVTLAADVQAVNPVQEVNFELDDNVIRSFTTPPYEHLLNPTTVAEGDHLFKVSAIDVQGNRAEAEISLFVEPPATYTFGVILGGVAATLVLASMLIAARRR